MKKTLYLVSPNLTALSVIIDSTCITKYVTSVIQAGVTCTSVLLPTQLERDKQRKEP